MLRKKKDKTGPVSIYPRDSICRFIFVLNKCLQIFSVVHKMGLILNEIGYIQYSYYLRKTWPTKIHFHFYYKN